MLEIVAVAQDPRHAQADALVVPMFKGGIEGPGAQLVLDALGLEQFPVTADFRGDVDQHLLLAAPGLPARTVLLVGLGRMDETDDERLRRAAGTAGGALRSFPRIATTLAEVHASATAVQAVAEGFHLGAYHDVRFRSSPDQGAAALREVAVLVPSARLREAETAIRRADVYARTTLTARDLVNTPPDRKRPPQLAEALVAAAGPSCQAVVRDERQLEREGFGGILAVGQGASAPPRLVELSYRPATPLGHVALIGKGITFDTGGLSKKTTEQMADMKSDMAGAAAVAAACGALADLDVRLQVTALLPLAENAVSGSALRPGDVIRMHNGTTVEVYDTDAEGRLLLGDALAYATRLGVDAVVDLATLTGSAVAAVGRYAAGLFGNDADLVDALRASAGIAGERVWPLPLWPELERFLDTPVADVNNTGDGPGAGATTAALFLQRFVGTLPWAHLDIAGPAFLSPALACGYLPPGGTGFGARTLLAWLERRPA